MEAKPTAGAAEEGTPERPAPPEREAARGAAQPEPEPDFCEQLAEPEPPAGMSRQLTALLRQLRRQLRRLPRRQLHR